MATSASSSTPQRWVRPNLDEPGLWRNQLPNKFLAVAVRGDLPALKAMIKAHPDFLSKRGNHNRTLLWEAVRRGRMPAVKWLVERGAEVDATGGYNNESLVQITPYCAAVYYRQPEAAAYLLAKGARLDIFRAAFMGEQALVERALAAEPELLNAEDPYDNVYFVPLLAFAVAGGQAGVTEFLLKRGADAALYSAQLLHYAGRAGRLDLIELLAAHGAEVAGADGGIFVSVKDLAIVRYLLAHGLSATRPGGINGFPPLIFVARGDKSESPEKARLLLENGADVDAVGPRGRTALHYAAAAGHVEVMRVLLEYGADVSLKDEAGATPLALARAAGKTAAVRLLRKTGAQRGGG